jgi:hypothetical protein
MNGWHWCLQRQFREKDSMTLREKFHHRFLCAQEVVNVGLLPSRS